MSTENTITRRAATTANGSYVAQITAAALDLAELLSPAAVEAGLCYVLRRDRVEHPAGHFDRQGRFYLADAERGRCCTTVRSPSRAFPNSENAHGRTLQHAAGLFGADLAETRTAARLLDLAMARDADAAALDKAKKAASKRFTKRAT